MYGGVAQLARARGSYPRCQEFKSLLRYSCANGSVVEHRLAKARVASSNLVSRSYKTPVLLHRGFCVFSDSLLALRGYKFEKKAK